MQKLTQILKSRTFWTIAILFVINGLNGVHSMIPSTVVPYLDGALALLATYFHVNPSQNYQG